MIDKTVFAGPEVAGAIRKAFPELDVRETGYLPNCDVAAQSQREEGVA